MSIIIAYLRGGKASGEVHEVKVRDKYDGTPDLPNHLCVDDMVYGRGKEVPLVNNAWNFLFEGWYKNKEK